MPQEDRTLHIVSEAIAVLVVVPWLIWIVWKKELSDIDRLFLLVLAIGTLLVDGYLLIKWYESII